MANAPAAPWTLQCTRCPFHIIVNARGSRTVGGRYIPGSGEQAADWMREHVEDAHGMSWIEFLEDDRGTGE